MSDLKNEPEKDKNTVPYPNEILTFISGIVPNTKYFDVRFDHLQSQIDEIRRNQDIDRYQIREFKEDVDRRFSEVDRKFEQVDKRFEQVDKRFEQIIASIDKLGDKLEYRDRDQRNFTLKMFSIAIAISIIGVLGAFFKLMGIF